MDPEKPLDINNLCYLKLVSLLFDVPMCRWKLNKHWVLVLLLVCERGEETIPQWFDTAGGMQTNTVIGSSR